jgi:hypothetical protein
VITFGIIAEGITDQIVIENILAGCFGGEDDELMVNYVQPPLDQTGQSSEPAPGGWGMVFKSLETGDHRKALQWADYVVIQIDTDVSEQPGFDVLWREGGRELTVEELIARVIGKLQGCMGQEFCTAHGDRLIFAVAVPGIECWLLPLFFDNNKAEKIAGCLAAVNRERLRRNRDPLSRTGHRGDSKDPRSYADASNDYVDHRKLMAVYARNPSLRLFVERLESIRLTGTTQAFGGGGR